MFCSLRSCSYLYYLWHFFYDPNVATVVRSHFNNINAVCPHAPSLSLSRHPVVFPKQLLDHKVVDILLSVSVCMCVVPLFSYVFFTLVFILV